MKWLLAPQTSGPPVTTASEVGSLPNDYSHEGFVGGFSAAEVQALREMPWPLYEKFKAADVALSRPEGETDGG